LKDNRSHKVELRINREIKVPFVRVVGENMEPTVMLTKDAITKAESLELDLVEISPNAEPPVCRIIDYQKFLYQQKKKQKEIEAKAQKEVLKEIRFGPQTDDHDFIFKLNHARNFLIEGCKVKAYVFFKGRTIMYKEQGETLLLKLAKSVEDLGKIDKHPTLEGKRMIIIITPKKNR
jgi:translation initiation factor IF-3